MSKTALVEYEDAQVRQATQNDARRIRARVESAQNNPDRAGRRWSFELIQNAHDAGPRDGDALVDISFIFENEDVVVSHTGKSFTSQELAALLSGGSSKEFDDEETTGRFGTGFLVTHGLSPYVDVDGVIDTSECSERFRIELVRDGDENSIKDNIELSKRSIENATPLSPSWVSANPTVSFTYKDVNCDVAHKGLAHLQRALPYLFATCEKLGQVTINRSGHMVTFKRGGTTESTLDNITLRETAVTIHESGESTLINAVCLGEDAESKLLVIVENQGVRHRLILPDDEFPRLFITLPIAETNFLPFNVILDGAFNPEQERDSISMNDDDKMLINVAMSHLPLLVRYAVESDWIDAHRLAQLSRLDGISIKGTSSVDWWNDLIYKIAKEIAAQPVISTNIGRLPALHRENIDAAPDTASFLVASVNADTDELFDYDRIHGLASRAIGLTPPDLNVAPDWTKIASDWEKLGVDVKRFGIEELTDWVKKNVTCISDLPITGDRLQWLTDLFLIVSEIKLKLGESYDPRRIINGLLPDQYGMLRNVQRLRVDDGIPDKIKDVAAGVNLDLRARLLHEPLLGYLRRQENESARDFICQLLGERYSVEEAVTGIVEQLRVYFPEGNSFSGDMSLPALRSSAQLISYLSETEDVEKLRRCPLLASDDAIVRLAPGQQLLAPVSYWPLSAQPYSDLYTKPRLLSDQYCRDDSLAVALDPLIARNMVIPAPLYEARPEINDSSLLYAMSADDTDMTGVVVNNESFGRIAFLATDLVQRCGRDPQLAKLLLQFVLKIAVREDQCWSQVKQVDVGRAPECTTLSLYGSTWPFELKVRSWVPVPISEESEEKGYRPVPANEVNLQNLYDPSLLRDNPGAVELLEKVFGFRQLTLLVDSLDEKGQSDLMELLQGQHVESAVRNLELLKTADANPEAAQLISELGIDEIQEIRKEYEERNRMAKLRETNRSFGHAAQAALADALRPYGLKPILIDHGYDYKVELEDAPFTFKVGSYLLEVKATTSGDVRLTPLQAKTASENPERFVLCVIDLDGQAIRDSWTASDVEPFAKIVTNISQYVVGVYDEVDTLASYTNPVHLRNEQQLRYGISANIWNNGVSISQWVQSLKR